MKLTTINTKLETYKAIKIQSFQNNMNLEDYINEAIKEYNDEDVELNYNTETKLIRLNLTKSNVQKINDSDKTIKDYVNSALIKKLMLSD